MCYFDANTPHETTERKTKFNKSAATKTHTYSEPQVFSLKINSKRELFRTFKRFHHKNLRNLNDCKIQAVAPSNHVKLIYSVKYDIHCVHYKTNKISQNYSAVTHGGGKIFFFIFCLEKNNKQRGKHSAFTR